MKNEKILHTKKTPELDTFDLALLKILQKNNSLPLRELADQVCLSAASVQRRTKKLIKDGVITGNVALIDPESVREVITIIVEVQAVDNQGATLSALKDLFNSPSIQQCYYLTGDADFFLIMTVPSMSVFQETSDALFHNNPLVKGFKTSVVLDRVKATMDVPLR